MFHWNECNNFNYVGAESHMRMINTSSALVHFRFHNHTRNYCVTSQGSPRFKKLKMYPDKKSRYCMVTQQWFDDGACFVSGQQGGISPHSRFGNLLLPSAALRLDRVPAEVRPIKINDIGGTGRFNLSPNNLTPK